MIIPINDNLRIRSTEHCWQMERKRTRKGIPAWEAFKYYGSVQSAVVAAGEREIRLTSTDTLADGIEAVHRIATRYSTILDDALKELKESTNDFDRRR